MEKYENSIEIWESLIEEQDNIAEVHYFLGLAYRNINTNTAKECVSKAKEVFIDFFFQKLKNFKIAFNYI